MRISAVSATTAPPGAARRTRYHWVDTILGNVKTSLSGAYHAFGFDKYAERYLGAIAYRFNRRFDLHALPNRLLVAAVASGPRPEQWIRMAETHC